MRGLFSVVAMLLALAVASVSAVAQTNAVACAEAAWPAALAPAYRDFAAKCEAGAATRGDLIALKKFIAASAVDGATKTNLTRQARAVYQRSKKRSKVRGQRSEVEG